MQEQSDEAKQVETLKSQVDNMMQDNMKLKQQNEDNIQQVENFKKQTTHLEKENQDLNDQNKTLLT